MGDRDREESAFCALVPSSCSVLRSHPLAPAAHCIRRRVEWRAKTREDRAPPRACSCRPRGRRHDSIERGARRDHARYRAVPARTPPGPPLDGGDAKVHVDKKRLDLEIDFKTGGRFACPECGKAECPVHDTVKKTWRHLNFFQHEAYLQARVARIDCPDCGVRLVNVPWARPGSGFTL